MIMFFAQTSRLFDRARKLWESQANRRMLGIILLVIYVSSLIVIELGRRELLPQEIVRILPRSHYFAISFTFSFLLYIEVIDLVFGITRSFSYSVGKQFEIFSLILLRQSFKEFAYLPEPLSWPESPHEVLIILSNAGGALIIFGLLFLYYRILFHQPITQDEKETSGFISSKKAVSLFLLAFFAASGFVHLIYFINGGKDDRFFATFYTVLVFSDILIVLLSLRYSHSFSVVFRNSGFALATVMLRLALTAPPFFNALLGISALIYVLGVKVIYNLIVPVQGKSVRHPSL